MLRKVSKAVTWVAGGVAKGGVKVVGKAISMKNKEAGETFEDIGNSVINASKSTIDSVAQFADGAIQGSYGVLKNNDHHKRKGWENIKDSTTRTVKNWGTGLNYTGKSTMLTFTGIKNKDKRQIKQGLKNIGKVAATNLLAYGIWDVADGYDMAVHADDLHTRNENLVGAEHEVTGVRFEYNQVEMHNGRIIEGIFPVFDSQFRVVIAEELFLSNDDTHFRIANETLYASIQQNPSLAYALHLTPSEVQALANGITPSDFVWHHHEEPGVIQLVDRDTHTDTGHTGGRELWGGGSLYR